MRLSAYLTTLLEPCRPDVSAPSVLEIDLEQLRAWGIEALLLDLDNTIVMWRSQEVTEEILAWVKRVRDAGIRLCIVSNTGTVGRVRPVAELLDLPYFVRAAKPRLRAFRRAAASLGLPPEKVAVVGDQIFTDILGGRRAGMTTVLVDPINPHREFITTRCMRVVERAVRRYTQARVVVG